MFTYTYLTILYIYGHLAILFDLVTHNIISLVIKKRIVFMPNYNILFR